MKKHTRAPAAVPPVLPSPASPSLAPAPAATLTIAEQAPPTEAELAKLRAKFTTRPGFNGSLVVAEFATGISGKLELTDLIDDFKEDVAKIWDGDMAQAEAMLFAQAQALQSIFVYAARQARHTERLHHQDILLRMALKAQAQCRATLETLANIKNPPVLFARQANINHGGQQQVNNAAVPPAHSPAAISASGAERSNRRSSTR